MDLYELKKKAESLLLPIDSNPCVCVYEHTGSDGDPDNYLDYAILVKFSNELGLEFCKFINGNQWEKIILIEYFKTPEAALTELKGMLMNFIGGRH